MKFRHEFKHVITNHDYIILNNRLSNILQTDKNGDNGKYNIRSLYFDNIYDTVLREKINGVNNREKFRIRSYNNDYDFIRLEKKSKINGLCNKVSDILTAEEVEKILDNNIEWMKNCDRKLVRELFIKMNTRCLEPKTLVDYTRQAYTFMAGNVRITLDSNIRTGLYCKDFLNPECPTIQAGDNITILEVKWDEYLPDIIRDIVQLDGRQASSFSKYAACRIYG